MYKYKILDTTEMTAYHLLEIAVSHISPLGIEFLTLSRGVGVVQFELDQPIEQEMMDHLSILEDI